MSDITFYKIQDINPEPWEASLGSTGKRAGKIFIQFHKPEGLRQYQEAIKDEFIDQNPHRRIHEGTLAVSFYFWRQVYSYEADEGKRRNRRANYADATNLQKALEDALQGILYDNDRDVHDIRSVIVEQGPDASPFILVAVSSFDEHESQGARLWRAALETEEVTADANATGIQVDDFF